ncbi:MAG: hypothetical protein K0R51_218 [Cytophagaceae bacterium]|jgi:hypothetical protein|nr:hypothetical protein [Cytophagaceae bacterium]
MKTNHEAAINKFFEDYDRRFNEALSGKHADIEGTVNSFAESFIEASPVGIIVGNNDAQFRKAIPQGYEFYKSIGTKSMNIISKEITALDEMHFVVKTHWLAKYETQAIDFDIFYILQKRGEEFKIFAYVTGDEKKVLKEKGLIKE